jgi:hypothetical protein
MNDEEIIDVVQQVVGALGTASFQAADHAARTIVAPRAKTVLEMLGEYLREASVLIMIFVPVEILLPDYLSGKHIDPRVLHGTIYLSLGALAAGILLEKLSVWLTRKLQ